MHNLDVRCNSRPWLIMLSRRPYIVIMGLHSVITWAQIYTLFAIYTFMSIPAGNIVQLHCQWRDIQRHCSTSMETNIWDNTTASMSRKFHCVRSIRSIITSLAHSLLSQSWEQLPNSQWFQPTNYTCVLNLFWETLLSGDWLCTRGVHFKKSISLLFKWEFKY